MSDEFGGIVFTCLSMLSVVIAVGCYMAGDYPKATYWLVWSVSLDVRLVYRAVTK